MNTPDVSPCPFCKSEDVGVNPVGSLLALLSVTPIYFVRCRGCWATGPQEGGESIAVVRWNERSSS